VQLNPGGVLNHKYTGEAAALDRARPFELGSPFSQPSPASATSSHRPRSHQPTLPTPPLSTSQARLRCAPRASPTPCCAPRAWSTTASPGSSSSRQPRVGAAAAVAAVPRPLPPPAVWPARRCLRAVLAPVPRVQLNAAHQPASAVQCLPLVQMLRKAVAAAAVATGTPSSLPAPPSTSRTPPPLHSLSSTPQFLPPLIPPPRRPHHGAAEPRGAVRGADGGAGQPCGRGQDL
jgi:hypothetical protein